MYRLNNRNMSHFLRNYLRNQCQLRSLKPTVDIVKFTLFFFLFKLVCGSNYTFSKRWGKTCIGGRFHTWLSIMSFISITWNSLLRLFQNWNLPKYRTKKIESNSNLGRRRIMMIWWKCFVITPKTSYIFESAQLGFTRVSRVC